MNKSVSNNASRTASYITNKLEQSQTASNTETSLTMMRASNYLDQIKTRIKHNLSSNLKTYLMIAIPLLVVIIYIGFKYNFNARNISSIAAMSYPTQINPKNLENCSSIDISMQYKLCDYYISSSYMTPCVGNQHYDYVSLDMISQVLQSGARYIQIPICESDVGPNAIPIVGTTQYGQRLVTSLNTLDAQQVFNVIHSNAFLLNKEKINYPLIIHLVLNTTNPYTLGVLADYIKLKLSDKLCNVQKYQTYPVALEKLCNLLGQIIIIATPEYVGSKLEPYIVPISSLYKSYYYGDLAAQDIPPDSSYTNSYNNRLSTKQQTRSNAIFKSKYPSLDYIVNNSSTIGAAILEDKDILNNLTNFNKVGLTLIKPHQASDVVSANYDPTEAVYNGCQFISMNFQINDNNMKNYIKIFQSSSFVLKPASLRFSEAEEPTVDLQKVYRAISPTNSRVVNKLFYEYNNLLIALESYSTPGNYLTHIESNLRFNQGSVIKRDKFNNKTYSIGINQCFLIKKSTVSMGTADIPMFLASPTYNNYLVSQNGNSFNLEEQKNNKTDLYQQSFVFENSSIKDVDDLELYLMRTITLQNPVYLANQNRLPTTYAYNPAVEAQNNMSFIIHVVPFNIQLKIMTLYDGSMKSMTGGVVGILENNINNGTGYILEAAFTPVQSGGINFNYLKDQFFMKNSTGGSYLSYDSNNGFLYDKAGKPGSKGIFNLKFSNGFFSMINSAGQELILYENNLLKFVKPDKITSNENLFKIAVSYLISTK
jgi:hypothetical protein